MSLLSVRRLSLCRNDRFLLHDISFDVAEGEYLTIIGPNGAGKSTLLKCIDRLLTTWTGDIFFGETPLRQIPRKELAKRVAYVQQSAATGFAFTVRQIVEMGRFPHLQPFSPISQTDQEIVDDALQTMGIVVLADRYVDTLSGGEMQKVQIAAALAQQADVLFLDEPTTYLDYKHQSEIGSLLRTLSRERQKTIVEVTHDVNRALVDATHVIALSGGRLIFDGSPQFLMNPENLRSIYNVDFQLVAHPTLPLKIVVPGV